MSDNKSMLAEALAKAQAEMKNAALNHINPHFKSKYADLAGIRDTVTPALTKNGLSYTQTLRDNERGLYLVTTLRHASGETVESEFPVTRDIARPQAMGSAITYARRYSLSAMCGISADEDDDANAAEEEAKSRKPAKEGGVSKRDARADSAKLYEALNACETLDALWTFWTEKRDEIYKQPADWRDRMIADLIAAGCGMAATKDDLSAWGREWKSFVDTFTGEPLAIAKTAMASAREAFTVPEAAE